MDRLMTTGATALALLFGTATVAAAQGATQIDVPAQPLGSAIAELAAETGWQVSAPAGVVAGKRSVAVRGTMTPAQALAEMLRGTGVAADILGTDGAVLSQSTVLSTDGDGEFIGDDIIITGERTERTIAETASSVTVRTGEDLEKQADSADLRSIYNRTANVNGTGLAGGEMPTVRGVRTSGEVGFFGALFSGGLPRLTIQVDGRPQSLGELQSGDVPLWDVDQVELFRGPQTTTQGQNAIAGAIIVNTNDPTYDYEVEARALFGNFETYQASFLVNAPLIEDELALRVSVDGRTHESFVDVIGTSAQQLNADPKKDEHRNTRLKMLYEPEAIPGLELKATFANTYTSRLFRERVDDPSFTISTNLTNSVFQNETNALTFDVNYAFSDRFQISNTASFTDVKSDFVIPPVIGNGPATDDRRQFNFDSVAEFDDPDLGVNARLGFSLDYAESEGYVDIRSQFAGVVFSEGDDLSYGAFGEITWSPTNWVDLTVGGRYQRDTSERTAANFGAVPFPPPFPPLTLDVQLNQDNDNSAFMPNASIAFHPVENVTVGASVSRGYNPGGSSLAFAVPNFSLVEFDSEFVWNYELFWRTTWLDDRLSFNGNLFYADWTDKHVTLLQFLPSGGEASFIFNAGDAVNYGVEMDVAFVPFDGLNLYGSLGLLQTDFKDAETPLATLTGNEFSRAPSVTASIAADYSPIDDLTLGVEGNYTSSYFSDATNTPAGKIDGRFIVNAKVSYDFDENVTIFGAVTNLFDTRYELDRFVTGSTLGDPLEFEIGAHIRF